MRNASRRSWRLRSGIRRVEELRTQRHEAKTQASRNEVLCHSFAHIEERELPRPQLDCLKSYFLFVRAMPKDDRTLDAFVLVLLQMRQQYPLVMVSFLDRFETQRLNHFNLEASV